MSAILKICNILVSVVFIIDSVGNQNYTDIAYLVKKAQKNKKINILLERSFKLTLFITIFVAYFFLFNLYRNQNSLTQVISKNLLSQKGQVLSITVPVLPVRLIIPQINVEADIKYVGVTPEGAMEVPNNIADVGLFKLGPWPGEKGSAVISGHVDGKNGEVGVFFDLYKLKKGDKLYIEDDKGASTVFVVREKRLYDPGYANDVFSSSDSAHLNLITCDGVWDGVKKSYSKRLVIFTDQSTLDNNYN